ncbi:MAG: purine-nucleoside phosphorylase [Desulfomonile tiedjei]|nr:purine-nucleoside phosphorylase [Desulfomonile tiedjei]
METLYQSVRDAVRFLRARAPSQLDAAIILGTGLGRVADRVQAMARIPYPDIPHFLESTVEGHKGDLVFGTLGGRNVAVMEGRLHYYEGYTLQQTTLPVRILRELGAQLLLINSAAGGLDPHYHAGDVMVVTDHINLMGDTPLRGVADERLGERFPDMSNPYDRELTRVAGEAATDLGIPVRHGVYAAVAGPNLETPAETRMLRILGADAVGMSTVPEVIVANQVGFRTLALAAITNVNIPDKMEPVSVQQVIANAEVCAPKIAAILEGVLERCGFESA